MRTLTSLVAAILLATPFLATPLLAQVPTTLNYQGRLLQNTADQDAVDGTVDIDFSLWTEPTGGTEVWSESWSGVPLSTGIFSVILGSNGSPLDAAIFQADSSLYLELTVDGETMSPRQVLGSAPFAMVDDPANELQDLELAGDTLTLSDDPTTVDLAKYLDDTDEQDLSLAGNTLSLEGDPTAVDLSGYLDNTDAQTLSLAGDTLTISGSGSTVDLASGTTVTLLSQRLGELARLLTRTVFVTSSATQGRDIGSVAAADATCQGLADTAGLGGTYLAWLSDSTTSPAARFDQVGGFALVDGTRIADDWDDLTDGTLAAAISLDESGIAVANPDNIWTGTNVDGTAAAETCTDWTGGNGQLGHKTLAGAGWTANIASGSCTLTGRLYCFGQVSPSLVDQQLSLVGDLLELTSLDGPDTVDLSKYLDDTNTDNQILSLSGNSLELTSDDGTDTVDLAKYLDDTNTDNQALSLSGNSLELTSDDGIDTVDLSPYVDTDNQTLSLSGNNLRLTSDAGLQTVSLASFLDDTDEQTLSITDDELTISGSGSTVDLFPYIDNPTIADVLDNGNNAGGTRSLVNLNSLSTQTLQVTGNLLCDASTAGCVTGGHVEDGTLAANDLTAEIYLLHVDCEGECTDFMSPKDGCDVIESQQNTTYELRLLSFSCIHGIDSNSNGFTGCGIAFSDNTCRSFRLDTQTGSLPCANGTDHDATIICMATDIPR